MSRGRPPLAIGTYGKIQISGDGPYVATARFRDRDGATRKVERAGETKGRAEAALKAALADRQRAQGDEVVQSITTVTALNLLYLAEVRSALASTNTHNAYESASKHIARELGSLRLGECTVGLVDAAIQRVKTTSGPGAAKTMRSVLNGMFSLAVRHGALDRSPVREVQKITGKPARGKVRALTDDEVNTITDFARSSERAVALDLPDLVEMMLAIGTRLGETLALRESVYDLDADVPWVEVCGTLVRVKGKGLIVQEWTKTDAGWRKLPLPPFAVSILRRRETELRFRSAEGVVFPSPQANRLRDTSGATDNLRELLDSIDCTKCAQTGYQLNPTGAVNEYRGRFVRDKHRRPLRCNEGPFSWVTSHVFRKTVATRLDDAGFSPRDAANFLGHSNPSLTQNLYMDRVLVNPKAAAALDR